MLEYHILSFLYHRYSSNLSVCIFTLYEMGRAYGMYGGRGEVHARFCGYTERKQAPSKQRWRWENLKTGLQDKG
jgi:hypothetical protein